MKWPRALSGRIGKDYDVTIDELNAFPVSFPLANTECSSLCVRLSLFSY